MLAKNDSNMHFRDPQGGYLLPGEAIKSSRSYNDEAESAHELLSRRPVYQISRTLRKTSTYIEVAP